MFKDNNEPERPVLYEKFFRVNSQVHQNEFINFITEQKSKYSDYMMSSIRNGDYRPDEAFEAQDIYDAVDMNTIAEEVEINDWEWEI
jgi:hypothetical protein